MRFRVRAFVKHIERGDERPALRAEGVIQGKTYFLSLDDLHFEFPALEVGEDRWGPFAVIEEGERPIEKGFVLRVTVDASEDDDRLGIGPGCMIELHRPSELILASDAARGFAVDPGRVNLLLPPSASVAVYFNHAGSLDGHGAMIRGEFRISDPSRPH